jgi:hypothetical protein
MIQWCRVLAVAVALMLVGCATWRATTAPLPEVVRDHPDRIRVTRRDSGQVEVRGPVLVSDTLRGTREDRRIAIPVDDILRVETRGFSAGKSSILIGGLIVAATAVLIYVLIDAMTSW